MTTTTNYIVYGITNWIDLKCDNNQVCIDYCCISKNEPAEYIKKYSMPYNSPKLKFIILCDREEDCEEIQENLCLEILENYQTDNYNWFNNFDIEIINKYLSNTNYKILINEDLDIFHSEQIKKRDEEIKKKRERIQRKKNKKN